MEIDSDNVAEVQKYAFLLGSALKNEDTEQFFSIYDSIIPRDLPDSEVQEIKKQARQIAELPEGQFNDLVFRARHFSLAPAGNTMSCRDSPRKKWSTPAPRDDDSEDEGVGSTSFTRTHGHAKSDTSSHTTKHSLESDMRRFDDDSGVCNSSKATNSIGSLSDHESDYESNRGQFDYFPPQVKIRSGCGLSLDYDEAHDVKSNHSSQDVNSPRSDDLSDGIELVNLSSRRVVDYEDDDDEFNFQRELPNQQDDFNTDEDSDDDPGAYHKYFKQGYRPLKKDTSFQPNFESSQRYWGDMPPSSSSLRSCEVDQKISLNLKEGTSPYSRYSSYENYGRSASSEKVKIEKNSYKKDDPPFGRDAGQFDRVASSIEGLISGKAVSDCQVKNMPEGRKLAVLTPEGSKKKKKKKRSSKDDVGKDENGNPIEGLDVLKYRQMRESPSSVGSPAGNNRQHDQSYGTFPNIDIANKEQEEGSNKTQEPRKRKKTNKKNDVKRAEDYPNYQGNKEVDELIAYIGGQDASAKKPAKKVTPAAANTDDIPAKVQKPIKKSKDKKLKSLPPSPPVEQESDSKGENSAELASLDQQGGSNNMGNLSAKTDVDIPVENGDVNSLLNENDRKIEMSSSLKPLNHMTEKRDVICKDIVKEKEGSRTNIKREAASETSAMSVNDVEMKKAQKSTKASKAEKTDNSTSKPETNALKETNVVATSVTVKQKNAKNKKTKPSSPTTKVEQEELPSPNLCNHQPSIPSIANDNLLDKFIFTDIDVVNVPKEAEFQVVGKKKKKLVKETGSVPGYHSNNGGSINQGFVKSSRVYDDKRPSLSSASSKTAAPNTLPTSPIETDTRARDLSPSAFPALCSGKRSQSLQEGRRNSTGDVPIPISDLKSQDDSDIESVKSLPATKVAGCAADMMLSPRLNMSYAKMAASAKQQSVVQCSSDGVQLLEGSDDQAEHDHKVAVWKGSPRERRHSIGSSPEEVNIAKSTSGNSAATASLKAGSQENIKAESVTHVLESSVVGVKGKVWDIACRRGEGVAQQSEGVSSGNKEVSVVNESDRVTRECMPRSSLQVNPTIVSSSASLPNTCTSVSSTSSISNSKQIGERQAKMTSSSAGALDEKVVVNSSSSSSSGSSSKTIYSNSSVHKHDLQKPKTSGVVYSNSNKKQKSVIFLDKRVEETPENLGISFGFEMEPTVNRPGGTNDVQADLIKLPKVSVDSSAACKVAEQVTFLAELVDTNIDTEILPSQLSSSTGVINSAINSSSSNETSATEPVKNKVSTHLVRLNGVVAPTQGQQINLDSAVVSNVVDANVDVAAAASGSSAPAAACEPVSVLSDVVRVNEVLVYYGEKVVTLKKDVVGPSTTNGPTRYRGRVGFVKEEPCMTGNFNVAEVAAYLTREWDRTLQLQQEDPGRAVMFVE